MIVGVQSGTPPTRPATVEDVIFNRFDVSTAAPSRLPIRGRSFLPACRTTRSSKGDPDGVPTEGRGADKGKKEEKDDEDRGPRDEEVEKIKPSKSAESYMSAAGSPLVGTADGALRTPAIPPRGCVAFSAIRCQSFSPNRIGEYDTHCRIHCRTYSSNTLQ